MKDMRKSSLMLGAAALALSGWLAACEREEGPAEEVGEAIDQGSESTGRALESTGDQMENAGEKMQEQGG